MKKMEKESRAILGGGEKGHAKKAREWITRQTEKIGSGSTLKISSASIHQRDEKEGGGNS